MFPTKDTVHMNTYTCITGCNSLMNVPRPFQTLLYKAVSNFSTFLPNYNTCSTVYFE